MILSNQNTEKTILADEIIISVHLCTHPGCNLGTTKRHIAQTLTGWVFNIVLLISGDISGSLFDTFPLWRRIMYTIVTHFKFDIMIATVIGLNVIFMAVEYYKMPKVRIKSLFLHLVQFL